MSKLRPVVAVQDDDCHWYIIPKELHDLFLEHLRDGETDEWETFKETWSYCRTGGDLNNVQLYAEI